MNARSDLIGGAGWMAFGLAIVAGAWRMDRYEQMGATLYTMPGFVPGLIGATLVLLGAALALRGHRRLHERARAETATPPLNGRVMGMLVLCMAYAAVLLGRAPFWLATALFVALFIGLHAMGDRSPLRRALVALVIGLATSACIVVVFQELFLVRLP